jgi:hypothetical protein
MTSARVSRLNLEWASVGCLNCGWPYTKTLLLHRRLRAWSLVYDFTLHQPANKSCEVAPVLVLHDLYGISCPPVSEERRELAAALNRFFDYPTVMGSAKISRVDRNWASVYETSVSPREFLLFHREKGHWDFAYVFDVLKGNVDELSHRSAFSACAYAPANVIRDLYRIKCPPWRALHARSATKSETATMRAAFVSGETPKFSPSELPHVHVSACVSRLDPSWAVGGETEGEGGEMSSSAGPWPLWFHRQGGRWRLEHPPSHAIMLSLADCG